MRMIHPMYIYILIKRSLFYAVMLLAKLEGTSRAPVAQTAAFAVTPNHQHAPKQGCVCMSIYLKQARNAGGHLVARYRASIQGTYSLRLQ